jgi:type II secretory pathway pseudopilin PulG
MAKNKNGFTLVEALIILVVIGIIGAAFLVVSGRAKKPAILSRSSQPAADITWQYDEQQAKWVTTGGTPPACPSPLFSRSPVNASLATGALYPGQYRGNDYKSHGGFRFDKSKSTDIQVWLPIDAKITAASRYLENDEVQYMLAFTNDCGISLRFDHLLTLSSKFKKYADKLPAAMPEDSRTTPVNPANKYKAGDLVATAVGHPSNHNISVDFGVYDLRQANQISANPKWTDLHQTNKSLDWYGICWFGLLPAADAAKVSALPPGDITSGTISDYCQTAAGTTLQ